MVAILSLVIAYGTVTAQRNRIWGDVYSLWQEAALRAPLMARPHIMLAETVPARDGDRLEALAAFGRALERDPGFIGGYVRSGQLHQELGHYDRAEKIYQQGLIFDAHAVPLWEGLGELYRLWSQRQGDPQGREWMLKSLSSYKRAVELAPDDDVLHNNLGNTYQVLNSPQEALYHHQRALHINPLDGRTYLNLGNAQRLAGHGKAAVESYRQALEMMPGFTEAWLNFTSIPGPGAGLTGA